MVNIRQFALALALTAAAVAADAQAATLVVDVAGARSVGQRGDAGNTVQTFAIGAGARVTALAYDVAITANAPSFLSEASLAFTGSTGVAPGVALIPGSTDDLFGTAAYRGVFDLVTNGVDFAVGADGILRLEFYEAFTDGGLPDAVWDSGTISVTYDAVAAIPEPATWGMMTLGLGLVAGAMRRRTRARVSFGV